MASSYGSKINCKENARIWIVWTKTNRRAISFRVLMLRTVNILWEIALGVKIMRRFALILIRLENWFRNRRTLMKFFRLKINWTNSCGRTCWSRKKGHFSRKSVGFFFDFLINWPRLKLLSWAFDFLWTFCDFLFFPSSQNVSYVTPNSTCGSLNSFSFFSKSLYPSRSQLNRITISITASSFPTLNDRSATRSRQTLQLYFSNNHKYSERQLTLKMFRANGVNMIGCITIIIYGRRLSTHFASCDLYSFSELFEHFFLLLFFQFETPTKFFANEKCKFNFVLEQSWCDSGDWITLVYGKSLRKNLNWFFYWNDESWILRDFQMEKWIECFDYD